MSDKKDNSFALLALVAIIAIVAIVMMSMNNRNLEKTKQESDVLVMDAEGNIIGQGYLSQDMREFLKGRNSNTYYVSGGGNTNTKKESCYPLEIAVMEDACTTDAFNKCYGYNKIKCGNAKSCCEWG